jgi:hypothetical protein
MNYKKIGRFDPKYFDIEMNRRAILEAIGSNASCPEGSKVFTRRINLNNDTDSPPDPFNRGTSSNKTKVRSKPSE